MRKTARILLAGATLVLFGSLADAAPKYRLKIPLPLNAGAVDGGAEQPEEPSESNPLRLILAPATLEEGRIGRPYSMNFLSLLSASGDGADALEALNVSWSLDGSSLPPGLRLEGSELKGTPTQAAQGSFEVVAHYLDSTGQQTYTLKIGDGYLYVKSISVGEGYTCAVTLAGGVKCWGLNNYGQLGNNSTTKSLVPVDAVGLTSGVVSVIAGASHACAITAAQVLKCWGANTYGQTGLGAEGDTTSIKTPQDVPGLGSGVAQVALSGYHSCALMVSGGVKCWGYNEYGQVGNNLSSGREPPTDVMGLTSGVKALTAGNHFNCAVLAAGGLKCWGYNTNGALGNGTTQNSLAPVDVIGLSAGVESVAAGDYHVCAVLTGGGLKCWGSNLNGQLGINKSGNIERAPVDVVGLSEGAHTVAVGPEHTCAVTTLGSLKCWGWNMYLQLGAESQENTLLIPTEVAGFSAGAASISTGYFHSCAVRQGGALECWGANFDGGLGNNSTSQAPVPVKVLEP